MSNKHLRLKSETTSAEYGSADIVSENTKKSDGGNESDIVATTGQDPIPRKTTYNPPCLSAFDVAVVGTVGADIVDCVQLYNVLPHSSYIICNIGMEQPTPSDNKIFVYNSDVVIDEPMAETPQPLHIKKEKINFRSSDQKATCVKVTTDYKKSKDVNTPILHLPNNAVSQDLKSPNYKQHQPSLVPEALTSTPAKDLSSILDQSESERQATAMCTERRFKCEHKGCEKSFVYQAHLRFHTQHAHMGYCPYICDFEGCGRCFYSENHLIVHLRAHSGVKPFVCPYDSCKKAFTTTGNLRNHIRTHTGEKPYKCSFKGCGKGFAELSSVKKHELTHTGEKPYPCRICGRCFSQAGSRNTHERHKHKDKFTSHDIKA